MVKRTFTACTHAHIYMGSVNIQHINLRWTPTFSDRFHFDVIVLKQFTTLVEKFVTHFYDTRHRHIISGQHTHLVIAHNIIINLSSMINYY